MKNAAIMKKLHLLFILIFIVAAASAQKKATQLKTTDLYTLINAVIPDASATAELPLWTNVDKAKIICWQSLKPEYNKVSKEW